MKRTLASFVQRYKDKCSFIVCEFKGDEHIRNTLQNFGIMPCKEIAAIRKYSDSIVLSIAELNITVAIGLPIAEMLVVRLKV
ncbi:hypothetical protein Fsol_00754 [Candidatus Fokinia solitaria]|uniref:Ferrous iron transporter FeoA domain-containing protein n=1 Tax=Candidatus Fokinia solitaria TaxID=1802984 RepID=A0A2U8BTJ4_9RICK|nr:hypothetical protein [Candidatus Fokinia solitaria]AWD33530.1 hypothetical protein Fsol_00754 [Candidatus Fokinia solitaria]